MIILIRFVEGVGWVQSVALSLLTVACVIFVFGNMLSMQLPRGPWGF